MARFYGAVQGARGEATRLGGTDSGLRTEACSWQGKIVVRLGADHQRPDINTVSIHVDQHGSSSNRTGDIFYGSFEDIAELIDWWHRRDEIRAAVTLLKGGR
jgi:hypothetical protein